MSNAVEVTDKPCMLYACPMHVTAQTNHQGGGTLATSGKTLEASAEGVEPLKTI